jgi:small subunit ribosomal protein S4
MGDPKKPKNKYERPKMPWNKQDITQRNELCKKYGLKNKKELWIAEAFLRRKRKVARELLALPLEQRLERQRELIDSLVRIGLLKKDSTLNDVLTLTVEDILERRLQTLVWRKGLARTPKQARQLVVHGHIVIGDEKVSVPGYIVRKDEEGQIKFAKPAMEEKIKAVAATPKTQKGESNE